MSQSLYVNYLPMPSALEENWLGKPGLSCIFSVASKGQRCVDGGKGLGRETWALSFMILWEKNIVT